MLRAHATINVFGRDRTGAVARMTAELFRSGANIEELVEQVTRREFHMNLVASWAAKTLDRANVMAGLKAAGRALGMDVTVRFTEPRARPRVAVFVTKELHGLDAMMKGVRNGTVKADPVLLVSNHREMRREARRWKLPFFHSSWRERDASERQVLAVLAKREVDLIVLARFMRILSPAFAWRYRNRIINIHPSLLPAFRGASAYRQAYDYGVKVVGVTAHFVTPDLDGGPIICQDALRLRPDEPLPSIIARGRALEAKTLLRAVKLHLAHRLDVHWGKVSHV